MNPTEVQALIDAIHQLAQPTFFDWLNLVVSVVAIMISGIAIYSAILVPKKLADHKNRISLFEKRYSIYLLLLDLYGVLRHITPESHGENPNIVKEAMEQLKFQQGFTNNYKFYTHIITALDSPQYLFSFDVKHPNYAQFQKAVDCGLLALVEDSSEEVDVLPIVQNLEFFYVTVKSFERYFYICPPKPNKGKS